MSGGDNRGSVRERRCPLTLYVKANRRIAIKRRSNGLNRPQFGPRIATAHYRVFAATLRRGCRLLHDRNPMRYTDANPLKIMWVDPAEIEQISGRPTREYGSVVDGKWDESGEPILDDRCYKSMLQHFEKGVPWKETPLFRWLMERIESGDPTAWKREQYLSRLQSIDGLYEQIEQKGYLSQRELFELSPAETLQANNDCIHPYVNEVGVDISRRGRLLWRSGGRHRLFIAKLLDLPEIPVKIWSRHREWQKTRSEESVDKDHPDLQNL